VRTGVDARRLRRAYRRGHDTGHGQGVGPSARRLRRGPGRDDTGDGAGRVADGVAGRPVRAAAADHRQLRASGYHDAGRTVRRHGPAPCPAAPADRARPWREPGERTGARRRSRPARAAFAGGDRDLRGLGRRQHDRRDHHAVADGPWRLAGRLSVRRRRAAGGLPDPPGGIARIAKLHRRWRARRGEAPGGRTLAPDRRPLRGIARRRDAVHLASVPRQQLRRLSRQRLVADAHERLGLEPCGRGAGEAGPRWRSPSS